MKKKQILEIIDSNFNIIDNDEPEISPNKESEAEGTTDHNRVMHSQNFSNDFYGRFGYYFHEGKFYKGNAINEDTLLNKKEEKLIEPNNKDNDILDKLEKIADILSKLDKDELNKIISLFEKHLK